MLGLNLYRRDMQVGRTRELRRTEKMAWRDHNRRVIDMYASYEDICGIHYIKERRPITLRVKGKREHLATEEITGKRQGMRKQMMEGEGIRGRRHRRGTG